MVGIEESRPLWVWENDGGARRKPGPEKHAPWRRKPQPPQDTPEGCDAMAAADMARAAAHVKGWGRTLFEHSAVMWSRRARLLEAGKAGSE
jgi:hypothetical protein